MDELPPVGLGTMGIDDPGTIATALEMGYRHLDTAQVYGNEDVVGEGIRRADVPRDEVFVATKVWADRLAPDDVRASTEASLDRLGLEAADLLYVHRPIEDYDPPATLGAFDDLRDDGLIRGVGVSNFSLAELDEAMDLLDAPLFAHQAEYHPLFQTPALIEHARDHGYHFVAYSPLAGGRADEIPELVEIAERHGTTPEAVSLAWLRAKDNVVTIPKASSEAHLRANLGSLEVALDPEDVARIDGIEREEELFPE